MTHGHNFWFLSYYSTFTYMLKVKNKIAEVNRFTSFRCFHCSLFPNNKPVFIFLSLDMKFSTAQKRYVTELKLYYRLSHFSIELSKFLAE